MPWYNAFGAKDVNGFTIPIWEEISIFFFLYLTPIFSTISMYRMIIGRNPGIFIYYLEFQMCVSGYYYFLQIIYMRLGNILISVEK